ncbi:hypothetical protein BCR33DRAFT_713044 [Rhizoclosmatium globosum]|uniref:Uncharacterized protein n=1 Tax=Rhizoclosmatium globosum TaxID=329046 RepID=A0A1Y2CVS6_9FUNG|nr:hypothetical protein BCR33DRAFT_713044 [Rhizoclosmatium globosum]|eukprot:ORY51132.1 hypothetical protein BCR33DRAFT_713044 [Rhizoclosmatium globosum]
MENTQSNLLNKGGRKLERKIARNNYAATLTHGSMTVKDLAAPFMTFEDNSPSLPSPVAETAVASPVISPSVVHDVVSAQHPEPNTATPPDTKDKTLADLVDPNLSEELEIESKKNSSPTNYNLTLHHGIGCSQPWYDTFLSGPDFCFGTNTTEFLFTSDDVIHVYDKSTGINDIINQCISRSVSQTFHITDTPVCHVVNSDMSLKVYAIQSKQSSAYNDASCVYLASILVLLVLVMH